MNGTPLMTYKAEVTRSVHIIEIGRGSLRLTEGQVIEVTEDSYGNVYHYTDDGREFEVRGAEPKWIETIGPGVTPDSSSTM